MKPPPVILVGAGPGDPNLITIAGLKAIQRAEVIIHDRLIPLSLLDEAPHAERIDAGKRAGDARLSQDQINALLIEHARRGKRVVRLKGGDPFVFGRGGEEVTALHEAGLEYEIIPGVSSATAAAALAGIPVTDRRASSAFTVVTGHEAAEGAPNLDWNALAQTGGTIVILMGWQTLPQITERLIAAGLDPTTPAAAIERASTPATAQPGHNTRRSLSGRIQDQPSAARDSRDRASGRSCPSAHSVIPPFRPGAGSAQTGIPNLPSPKR